MLIWKPHRFVFPLVTGSLVLLAMTFLLPSFADDLPSLRANPATLKSLSFRLVNDHGMSVTSAEYSASVFGIDRPKEYRKRTRVALQDGVFSISVGDLQQGRIRIWLTADEGGSKVCSGYGEYSFDLRGDVGTRPKKSTPTEISMKSAELLSGRVVAQDSGEPIAGAEVAPSHYGHHGTWVQWDDAVRTDDDGNYRIVTSSADGTAARHPKYGETEIIHDNAGVSPIDLEITLSPRRKLVGRLLDEGGKPVVGARVDGEISDPDGRFELSVSVDQWRSKRTSANVFADGFRFKNLPLRQFDLNGKREHEIVLEREMGISGALSIAVIPSAFAASQQHALSGGDPPYEFLDSEDDRIWKKAIQVDGENVVLGKIDLADASLLPGRIKGVAVDPKHPGCAFANGFVFLLDQTDRWDTADSAYYIRRVMTDSDGRFQFDSCPPGKFFIALGQRPDGYDDPGSVTTIVRPGKTVHAVIRAKE